MKTYMYLELLIFIDTLAVVEQVGSWQQVGGTRRQQQGNNNLGSR